MTNKDAEKVALFTIGVTQLAKEHGIDAWGLVAMSGLTCSSCSEGDPHAVLRMTANQVTKLEIKMDALGVTCDCHKQDFRNVIKHFRKKNR